MTDRRVITQDEIADLKLFSVLKLDCVNFEIDLGYSMKNKKGENQEGRKSHRGTVTSSQNTSKDYHTTTARSSKPATNLAPIPHSSSSTSHLMMPYNYSSAAQSIRSKLASKLAH